MKMIIFHCDTMKHTVTCQHLKLQNQDTRSAVSNDSIANDDFWRPRKHNFHKYGYFWQSGHPDFLWFLNLKIRTILIKLEKFAGMMKFDLMLQWITVKYAVSHTWKCLTYGTKQSLNWQCPNYWQCPNLRVNVAALNCHKFPKLCSKWVEITKLDQHFTMAPHLYTLSTIPLYSNSNVTGINQGVLYRV